MKRRGNRGSLPPLVLLSGRLIATEYPTKSELVFARKKCNLGVKSPYTAVYARARAFIAQNFFWRKIAAIYLLCDVFTMILRLLIISFFCYINLRKHANKFGANSPHSSSLGISKVEMKKTYTRKVGYFVASLGAKCQN